MHHLLHEKLDNNPNKPPPHGVNRRRGIVRLHDGMFLLRPRLPSAVPWIPIGHDDGGAAPRDSSSLVDSLHRRPLLSRIIVLRPRPNPFVFLLSRTIRVVVVVVVVDVAAAAGFFLRRRRRKEQEGCEGVVPRHAGRRRHLPRFRARIVITSGQSLQARGGSHPTAEASEARGEGDAESRRDRRRATGIAGPVPGERARCRLPRRAGARNKAGSVHHRRVRSIPTQAIPLPPEVRHAEHPSVVAPEMAGIEPRATIARGGGRHRGRFGAIHGIEDGCRTDRNPGIGRYRRRRAGDDAPTEVVRDGHAMPDRIRPPEGDTMGDIAGYRNRPGRGIRGRGQYDRFVRGTADAVEHDRRRVSQSCAGIFHVARDVRLRADNGGRRRWRRRIVVDDGACESQGRRIEGAGGGAFDDCRAADGRDRDGPEEGGRTTPRLLGWIGAGANQGAARDEERHGREKLRERSAGSDGAVAEWVGIGCGRSATNTAEKLTMSSSLLSSSLYMH